MIVRNRTDGAALQLPIWSKPTENRTAKIVVTKTLANGSLSHWPTPGSIILRTQVSVPMLDVEHSPAATDNGVVVSSLGNDADQTLRRQPTATADSESQQSCLVQIYPPDVVGGMKLIDRETIRIGRDCGADISLADSSVSRSHAIVCRTDQGYVVRDLDSTNGTLVNGEPIVERPLRSGDTLGIGSFLFKFLSAGSVEVQYHETVYGALTRDALTGTMNRRYLTESMQREIARSIRQQLVLSVVMLDIDHFKHVNDTHGHLVGDEVLREFGVRIQAVCRDDDMLARYGGEEFCLMLSATEREEALAMAERCRLAIADIPFVTGSGPLAITASFGLGCMDRGESLEPTALIQRADAQLYQAKTTGRNRVCG
jgi:diguanylate cyclase (GGDEF)-like protein